MNQTALIKPPWSMLKLNIVASVVKGPKHIGLSAIIRDYRGFGLAAMTKVISGDFPPFTTECLALLEGNRFAQNNGFQIQFVKTDAQMVVIAVYRDKAFSPE